MRRAEVGPLGKVGLAQDHGAGLPQPRGQEGIPRRDRALQGQRAGGGRHAVVGADVVLEQDGDAVEGTARTFRLAFGVEGVREGQRFGVRLDHRPQLRPLAVQGLDAAEIGLHDRAGRVAAGLHALLESRDGRLRELEGRRRRSRHSSHLLSSGGVGKDGPATASALPRTPAFINSRRVRAPAGRSSFFMTTLQSSGSRRSVADHT